MKKYIILILSIITLVFIYNDVSAEENIIPDEAIRFRVIANSNTIYDQNIKIQIRNEVQNKLFSLISNSNSIEETREIIKLHKQEIDDIVGNKLKELKYDKDYKVKYGYNYFPKKKYKSVVYKEGSYESLVIELGDGNGDNWWCVLFPPLCLLEAEDEAATDAEYTFFIKELIKKYL